MFLGGGAIQAILSKGIKVVLISPEEDRNHCQGASVPAREHGRTRGSQDSPRPGHLPGAAGGAPGVCCSRGSGCPGGSGALVPGPGCSQTLLDSHSHRTCCLEVILQ